jgi:hypothetical protein
MSMNHNMRLFSLLLNDSFTLLNAELNDKQPTKKETGKQTNKQIKLYRLGNFNTGRNSFVRSLTFILHNFYTVLDRHTLYIKF